MDLSTEHKIRDLKDRIEASVVIWKRKMNNKDTKSPWGVASGVSLEKREQFEERAETILQILKHRYPGTAQSSLDTSKIEHNKVTEIKRVLISLAHKNIIRLDQLVMVSHLNCLKKSVYTSEVRRRYSLMRTI